MMNFVYKIFGNPNEKIVKELQPVIAEINGWEEKMERMSNDELRNMTMEWQKQFTTEKEIAKE